jgi:predicted nuclease of predicted toxin-antitoxin system
MKVLIDECLPAALKENLTSLGHERQTVREAGFGAKKNGELLTLAERQWDVLLTSDRNIQYQQNMAGRSVAVLILCAKTNRMKDLLRLMPDCGEALRYIRRGAVVEIRAISDRTLPE